MGLPGRAFGTPDRRTTGQAAGSVLHFELAKLWMTLMNRSTQRANPALAFAEFEVYLQGRLIAVPKLATCCPLFTGRLRDAIRAARTLSRPCRRRITRQQAHLGRPVAPLRYRTWPPARQPKQEEVKGKAGGSSTPWLTNSASVPLFE